MLTGFASMQLPPVGCECDQIRMLDCSWLLFFLPTGSVVRRRGCEEHCIISPSLAVAGHWHTQGVSFPFRYTDAIGKRARYFAFLGCQAAADDVAARASGDISPRLPVAVPLRRASTGRLCRVAVGPPCLGDPVTLLDRHRGRRCRVPLCDGRERETQRRRSRSHQQDVARGQAFFLLCCRIEPSWGFSDAPLRHRAAREREGSQTPTAHHRPLAPQGPLRQSVIILCPPASPQRGARDRGGLQGRRECIRPWRRPLAGLLALPRLDGLRDVEETRCHARWHGQIAAFHTRTFLVPRLLPITGGHQRRG